MTMATTAEQTAAQMRALLAGTERPQSSERPTSRSTSPIWIAAIFFLALGLLGWGFSVWQVWQGWTSGVWPESSSDSAFLVLPFLFLWTVGTATTAPLRPISGRLRRLVGGDETTSLPLAEAQPEPLPAHEVPSLAEHIGPLRGLNDSGRATYLGCISAVILCTALMFIALAAIPVALLLGWFARIDDTLTRTLLIGGASVLAAIGLAIVWLAWWSSRRGRALKRGIEVVADSEGLRWRDTRTFTGEHTLAWKDVTAFLGVTIGWTSAHDPCSIYLLSNGRKTLLWTVPLLPSQPEAIAAERLRRLAVTRTSQPLRNATERITALARARSVLSAHDPHRRAEALRQEGYDLPPDLVPESTIAQVQRSRKRFGVGYVLLAVCILVLTFAQPLIQFYQSRLYGPLLAQAESSVPLFSDTMTPLDTLWTLAPSDSPGAVAIPADGGYVLRGPSGQTVIALAGPTFTERNLAITGDVSQPTTDSGISTQGGAGLIVRSNANQSTEVVFIVWANGNWSLSRTDTTASHPGGVWSELLSGTNRNVHGDAGAINTLSVVVRGTSDYCYINGSLVGFTTNDTAPTSGQVGLFDDDGAFPATFTNFAVYPVQ